MIPNRMEKVTVLLDQVWSQGILTPVDTLLAPNYTIKHDPGDPWAGHILDHAQYKERVVQSRAPFPDQRFDIREMVEADDHVVVAWHWHGTHRGQIHGFAPTGNVLTTTGMTLYYFEGDRISAHWQEVDRLGLYQQLAV
ncbi:Ester cyclase [Sulfidibacter corallicola]|uniref:Ester cyclase n=1 Tax=Sulfidibacter corallicola TaxID=2818388 RepID=A0A8A4TQS1_SULCO|nr:ester cyclase [Sulfidibacter corallicola]QTD52319.1 ester cyclase [Sulfidibacter corallicola]